jgi:hypothetical protein
VDCESAELPDLDGLSVSELKSLLRKQHAELLSSRAELLSNKAMVEALKLQVLKLRRMQFGHRSEKRAHQIEQLELWVEELEAADSQLTCVLEQAGQVVPRAPKPRREFPAHLPRETQTIAPSHSACPDCGGELKRLGDDPNSVTTPTPTASSARRFEAAGSNVGTRLRLTRRYLMRIESHAAYLRKRVSVDALTVWIAISGGALAIFAVFPTSATASCLVMALLLSGIYISAQCMFALAAFRSEVAP